MERRHGRRRLQFERVFLSGPEKVDTKVKGRGGARVTRTRRQHTNSTNSGRSRVSGVFKFFNVGVNGKRPCFERVFIRRAEKIVLKKQQ